MDIKTLDAKGLKQAYEGSYYTLIGVGGDLQEWVDGYHGLLDGAGIAHPTVWYTTTGESVNRFAEKRMRRDLHPADEFKAGLTFLLFPLEGMEIGKLAMFKLENADRWFDDVIMNMRAS